MTVKAAIRELDQRAEEAAALLKLLSHPNRLRIACELRNREASVGALEEAIGSPQPTLSRDLARMREEGLLAARRHSRFVFYRLADDRLARVIDALCAAYGPDTEKQRKWSRK